jgi:hypothetical protein
MLVTRNIISKNITFKDVNVYNLHQKDISFTFADLENKINIVKNVLQHQYNCKEGQSVLIGITTSTLQIAAFFACAELGLAVVIVDHNRNDNWINANYVDPKTASMLPIDFFLVTSDEYNIPKYKLFYEICETTVVVKNLDNLDNTPNNYLGCTENSILLKCTSSGTTGTAKLVLHNHKFLHDLVLRNKTFFYGNVCMAHNLNHGSSPATYFLPALCSEHTLTFVSYMITYIVEKDRYGKDSIDIAMHKFSSLKFDHLMIPYSNLIDDFLRYANHKNLNLYTLSSIKQNWLQFFLDGKVKNIISIFGCNETSGPTFINEIADPAFIENKYKLVDNFYDINLLNLNLLEVTMPVYGTKIVTNDLFEKIGDDYYHKGRNDLYRVNGHVVDVEKYNKTAAKIFNGMIIVDTMKDKLYLAIWANTTDLSHKLEELNTMLGLYSNGTHKIDKYAVLDQSKFYSGIKLDMEFLRDYFRKFV